MVEPQVGAGGWAYFEGPTDNRLRDYARAFPFVEVNATFYDLPGLATARRWRRTVPPGFGFAMKAPMVLTHRRRLRHGPALERDALGAAQFAHAIRATDLILETPRGLRLGSEEIRALRAIVTIARQESPETRLGLEARAYVDRPLPGSLHQAMGRFAVTDVVDLSVSTPRVPSDVVYTRLFGPGEGNRWEFTDDELRSIGGRADDVRATRVAFTFHGVRMYRDAARFLRLRETGSVPPVTKGSGLASLEEVLRDGAAVFPTTRQDLIRDHGWRVARIRDQTVHAASMLTLLPRDATYESLEEVLSHVGRIRSTTPMPEPADSRRS